VAHGAGDLAAVDASWPVPQDFGTWGFGTWKAWVLALSLAGLSIVSNLRFFPMMGIPISYAFAPRDFHLLAALLTGITAGFCEEFLFRGFLMNEFAAANYEERGR
jgi:membrane protease YdiL (CAAX protease family)